MRIVIVTSSQPSLNPRMVKEADVLAEAGYEVLVIGQYWNKWATEADKILMPTKKWNFKCVAGAPDNNKLSYFFTRSIHKIARFLTKFTLNSGIAELSSGRCMYQLYKEATRQKADLYIGHNTGAIAAVVKAARRNNAKCGFDAEDFHRMEVSDRLDSPESKCQVFLEEKYFHKFDYLTASSPDISDAYSKLFPTLKFHTILNVFPKPKQLMVSKSAVGDPLKLFWFSQSLGRNRGLKEIIQAIGLLKTPFIEFHILAKSAPADIEYLRRIADENGLVTTQLSFYEPIPPDALFNFASKFDIGLASEIGFSTNNKLALSNKLFTYISSGLALLSSNTLAQSNFMKQYPLSGKVYNKQDASSLAKEISFYFHDRAKLAMTKTYNYELGQEVLNWENEGNKFLKLVRATLDIH